MYVNIQIVLKKVQIADPLFAINFLDIRSDVKTFPTAWICNLMFALTLRYTATANVAGSAAYQIIVDRLEPTLLLIKNVLVTSKTTGFKKILQYK